MSPKLPSTTSKKLISALKRAGFIIKAQKGSHIALFHPERPGRIVTVPYHNKDLKKGTLKSILKQADIDVQTLIELL